ncbi:MAG: SDR family oxidoreductase [Caldibacillus thermoamylovorans]
MNPRLHGKTILITGASGGLGEQLAYQCAESGAHLILVARSYDKLAKIQEEIRKKHRTSVSVHKLDVGNTEEILNFFEQLGDKQRIDVLINNAGFGIFKTVLDATMDEAENMLRVNVLGLIAMTKMVLPKMVAQNSGHIINIASQAGKIATPKSSIYSATKKAVLGFTDALRMEVRDEGIFVTAVNPGPIETNFFHIADESGEYLKNVSRWVLKPEEVAAQIVKKMFTPTREINLPRLMNVGSTIYNLFPGLVEKVGKNAFFKK